MRKLLKGLDERNVSIIHKVSYIMYFTTLILLIISLFYRQFVLHQLVDEYKDIANIIVFNAVVLVAGILFMGGVTFPRIRIRFIILIYILFVSVGFLFTLFKYAILLNTPLSLPEALDKLFIILVICGAFMFVYVLFAYLGHKKIEKEI